MTTRREAILTLATLAIIPSCGGGGGGSDAGRDSGGSTSCGGIVQDNHGHSISVPRADVMAGTDRTYTLSGGTHTHTLTLTAAHFSLLMSGGMVIATTSLDAGHSHSVEVRCS